jgi:cellulose synthase/poly-beta-1,6-N-acetylglucosamine synthase-like glycosyltransferase
MMQVLNIINSILTTFLLVLLSYKVAFFVIGLFFKKTYKKTKRYHNYAILIAARNEEKVIGQLIDSINNQDYPLSMLKIYVVADNCTDSTAKIAAEHGAVVFERFNKTQVGKGYALDYLLNKIKDLKSEFEPEGYFIFDADNLLMPNYIKEMNNAFDSGEVIVTSYRNSKNFDTNWLSAGQAISFMRECRFVHTPRALLNTSTFVSGTGFLVSSKIMNTETGWRYRRLTEDIEFSIDGIINNHKVAYCDSAEFFDEQPETFKASWNQRMRWQKGFYQCFSGYGFGLMKNLLVNFKFSAYEMLLFISPIPTISFVWGLAYNVCSWIDWFITPVVDAVGLPQAFTFSYGLLLSSAAIAILEAGALMITERKRIHCGFWKKVLYTITYPLFLATYIPISIVALFKKVKWTQIKHEDSVSINEIMNDKDDENVSQIIVK